VLSLTALWYDFDFNVSGFVALAKRGKKEKEEEGRRSGGGREGRRKGYNSHSACV